MMCDEIQCILSSCTSRKGSHSHIAMTIAEEKREGERGIGWGRLGGEYREGWREREREGERGEKELESGFLISICIGYSIWSRVEVDETR